MLFIDFERYKHLTLKAKLANCRIEILIYIYCSKKIDCIIEQG
jgi:hypothetical protein